MTIAVRPPSLRNRAQPLVEDPAAQLGCDVTLVNGRRVKHAGGAGTGSLVPITRGGAASAVAIRDAAGRLRSRAHRQVACADPVEDSIRVTFRLPPAGRLSAELRALGFQVATRISERTGEEAWVGVAEADHDQERFGLAVEQARQAAEQAVGVIPGPVAVTWEDTLVLRALSAAPTVRRGLSEILEPLVEEPRRVQLIAALEALSAADFSVSEAARRLGIHRHSLESRLRQAEVLLGCSVKHGSQRLLVECALLARRMELTRHPPRGS